MRKIIQSLVTFFCRPVVLAGAFAIVMAGLYAFEKMAAHMPFVAMVITAISAALFIITRKFFFSAYFGMATVSIITIASTVKYRMKGFDLHVFDFGFTGEDPAAMRFLLEGYAYLIVPVIVLALLSVAFVTMIGVFEPRSATGWRKRASMLLASSLGIYLAYPLDPMEPRYFHYLGGFNATSFFVSTLDLQYQFRRSEFADRLNNVPQQPPYEDSVECGDPGNRPDIFMVLSESNTDPRNFPQLHTDGRFDDSFLSDDGLLHPLQVETFGGGTWVSQISVMSGLSSVDFGVQAPYLTTVLEGKVRGALPEVLARCGYRTVSLTPVKRSFVNEAAFMESIGFQTILDYDDIGASEYAHRDDFYFKAAEAFIRDHRRKGGGPLLFTLKTMFTHSPYVDSLLAKNTLSPISFGGDAPTDEYVNRMLATQQDFRDYLDVIRSLTTERGSIVLEYGDHQSYVTKSLVDEAYGGNALQDLRSAAYRTYYTVHSFGYALDMDTFPKDELDIGYLGAVLVKAARLPTSPMYRDLIELGEYCQGRFHDCADRDAVDRHLRKRADSGLLNVF
ncbi:sulfatase-like hydrolase/transferase [Arvimicrobium flavum]|uniref:sulfatase-like hydrolase/transferase n=1 Tax=Arvimicrobium flavum TaxID=3393320 RepID=UPI00237C237D|nr:sulfatase-like hydrolase/transferase [Mesorhizobium shangrilense]